MNFSKRIFIITTLPLIFFLQACTPTAATPSLAEKAGTNTPQPSPPPETPTIEPPNTEEVRSCPIEEAQIPMADLSDPLSAEEPLLAYLNSGGSLPALTDQLTASAMIPAAGSGIAETLINQDTLLDLVFLLVQADSAHMHPSGRMYIFLCDQDHYKTAYTSPVDENWYNPQIHTIQDLNGDNLSEIVFSETQCGAHTCFASTRIYSFYENELRNLMTGSSEDMPFPIFEISTSETLPPQIIVTASATGSVGAGPFQPFRRIWQWNPDSSLIEPGEDIYLETPFRIHAFYAAEDFFTAGAFEEALAAYDRVIQDTGLSDWSDPVREQSVLTAFSRFRKIQAYVMAGSDADAGNVLAEWKDMESDSYSTPFFNAAELFWIKYLETGESAAACLSVAEYAVDHKAELIDSLYFGYSNRLYEPADLCISELD
ncbi:MAG: hypothetical protein JXA25_01945 [Anaerolineales bacterium]|nr:hypothetical protein [Anaerolineales bacterium]